MKTMIAIVAATASLMLTACGTDPETASNSNQAEDFAARIGGGNGATPAPQASATPKVAQPLPNAAEGAYTPGTATDPQSATCDANRMGPFIGRVADTTTRTDIANTAASGREIRFLRPGVDFITPDAGNPRLNIMLDSQDIIRDARCG